MSGAPITTEQAEWVSVATVFMLGGSLTAVGASVLGIVAGVKAGLLLIVSGAVTFIASAWVWSP